MQRVLLVLVMALVLVSGLTVAQSRGEKAVEPAAKQEAQAPAAQPQQPPMMCPVMTPEQMKKMQEQKGGQMACCPMPQGGCPMHQQVQKELNDLRQRVEALEKQAKPKKK